MAERRYPAYNPVVGRSATFNPARASMPVMPSSMGYNPAYPGDIHSYPTVPSRHANGSSRYYYPTAPHPHGQGSSAYPVADETGPRSSRPRDAVPSSARTRRSSTIDSGHRRPIIITTNAPSSSRTHCHNPSTRDRSRSPGRDDHPSSHAPRRSRGMSQHGPAPPYSPTFDDDDEYSGRARGPDIVPASGRADPYRASRPTVVYPSDPRHTTVDIGDQYGYTKPGELAQYDLDHSKPNRHRHHDSFDHYARPNIYYNPERRGFNIETHRTRDSSNGPPVKSADARGGPPPTSWGLDKIPRSSTTYDPVSVPPPAPIPPPPTQRTDVAPAVPRERRSSNRHARPVSLYQEAPPRSSRDDEFYRPREEDRPSRKDRDHDSGLFIDDDVTNRGFGIRTEPMPEVDDRRERRERARREYVDSARRADDDLDDGWDRIERVEAHDPDDGKDRRRHPRDSHDEGTSRVGDGEAEGGRKLKDSLKAGLGLAASSVGLGNAASKDKPERDDDRERLDKHDRKDRERYHREPEEDRAPVFSSDEDDVEIISARPPDRHHPRDKVYASKDCRGRERDRSSEPSSDAATAPRERPSRDDADGPAKPSRDSPQADGEAETSRKKGRMPSFNPNDTEDLDGIKEQLASMKVYDKDEDGERVVVVEPPTRSRDASRSSRSVSSRRDPSTSGRDLVLSPEARTVRVVSPPPYDRERPETKPIRGILKTPSSRFPEDPNPIREGVAPHKNDDKLKDVPPGARWTRISRKIVNPDALEAGKERYEVRDDFVIVLRVLSREEIEVYAKATAVLRGESLYPNLLLLKPPCCEAPALECR